MQATANEKNKAISSSIFLFANGNIAEEDAH